MYCPNCGTEENQNTQFCRSCGSDLQVVRSVTNKSSSEAGASAAKVEIGNAFARQIDAARSAKELKKVTEKVLPQLTSFFETAQEKRLRRLRTGSLVSFVGLGAAVGFFIAAIFGDPDVIVMAAMGIVTLFLGIAVFINGYFFTVPDRPDGMHTETFGGELTDQDANDLLTPPSASSQFRSVTENTTRTLNNKMPIEKD